MKTENIQIRFIKMNNSNKNISLKLLFNLTYFLTYKNVLMIKISLAYCVT